MTYRGTIGAIEFELERAGVVLLPPFDARPLPSAEQDGLLCVLQDDVAFLVLDHRIASDAGGPVYVEYWRPLCAGEGGLAGMFVLTDSARSDAVIPAGTLAALAALLPPVA